jgi:leader peptidase (prepilin peptidase)/N-methyltransferase
VTAAAIGAVVASYVTTAAMRVTSQTAPEGPRSQCDGCRRQLGWWESVPLVSFALLRGRCRTCAAPISVLHPIGEGVGLLSGAAIALVAPDYRAAILSVMAAALLMASVVDIRTYKLPTVLMGGVAGCSALLALSHGLADLAFGMAAALFWFAVMKALAFFYRLQRNRIGLGAGDITLFAALSIWLGVASSWMVLVAAILGVTFAVLTGRVRKVTPTGPSIALAGFAIGLLLEAGIWPRL